MNETYINFMNLSGEELNKDFRRFCIEKGFDINSECSIFTVPSISGHDSYIISQGDNNAKAK